MHRTTGEGEHPAQLNAIMFDDLPSLQVAREAEDGRIFQYVEGLSEEEIGQVFSYSTTEALPQRFPLRTCWLIGSITRPIIAAKRTASSLF